MRTFFQKRSPGTLLNCSVQRTTPHGVPSHQLEPCRCNARSVPLPSSASLGLTESSRVDRSDYSQGGMLDLWYVTSTLEEGKPGLTKWVSPKQTETELGHRSHRNSVRSTSRFHVYGSDFKIRVVWDSWQSYGALSEPSPPPHLL